jgi:POT family proton-dependent oligopeptide transporter
VLCALVGAQVGWWAGFGLAGVGMLAGLIVFLRGKVHLEGHGEPPSPALLAQPVLGLLSREQIIYIGGLLGVGLVWLLVQRNQAVGLLLAAG